MKTVRVALYENRAQAEPSQDRLLQAGIQAQIHAESSIAKLWFVSRWQAGARLDVPLQQAQQAARLLRDWAAREPSFTNAIRCPECSSFRVDFPQFTEKSLLTNVAMGLLAELGFIQREYYCEDCHCMWAKRDAPPPHVRAHLAPNYFLEDADTNVLSSSVASYDSSHQ